MLKGFRTTLRLMRSMMQVKSVPFFSSHIVYDVPDVS